MRVPERNVRLTVLAFGGWVCYTIGVNKGKDSLKINLLSDLHLEFGDYNLEEDGDILILAGDICIINDLIAEWLIHPHKDNTFLNFFEECVRRYNKVFYVMGNHEHYGWDINISEMWLRKCLPDGITLLHNQVEEYNGYNFIGSNLWASYDNCGDLMNDFKQIKKGDDYITEQTLRDLNSENIQYLKDTIPNLENVIVITHHSPSMLSVDDSRKEMGVGNGYGNNLDEFIVNNPQIKYWFHGHIHNSLDYNIGETNVVCNPRGYVGHCINKSFVPDLVK